MSKSQLTIPSNQKALFDSLQQGNYYGLYVFVGEKTFTGPVVHELLRFLLTEDEMTTNLEIIEQERYTDSLLMEALQTMPLFGGRKVVLLNIPPFLVSKNRTEGGVSQTDPKSLLERLSNNLKRLDPHQIVLVIETPELDRRSKFYKAFVEFGPVLFMGVAERGRQGIHDFIVSYLSKYGKRMDSKAMEAFLEEIGTDDLVAAAKELDKLVIATHQKQVIDRSDIQNVVVRHRMEQVYQLTEAMASGNIVVALKSLNTLLEQGQPAILLLHTMLNFFNQLLVIRAFIKTLPPALVSENMRFDVFEREIMPKLRVFLGDSPPVFIQKTPPYGLYKAYLHAMRYERSRLFALLPELLEADLSIKGEWSTKPEIPLERLVLLGMGSTGPK